jgi:hypothetical protein
LVLAEANEDWIKVHDLLAKLLKQQGRKAVPRFLTQRIDSLRIKAKLEQEKSIQEI